MAWTQAELEALKRAYASGTLRVSYAFSDQVKS
jgi:hypothetical protein